MHYLLRFLNQVERTELQLVGRYFYEVAIARIVTKFHLTPRVFFAWYSLFHARSFLFSICSGQMLVRKHDARGLFFDFSDSISVQVGPDLLYVLESTGKFYQCANLFASGGKVEITEKVQLPIAQRGVYFQLVNSRDQFIFAMAEDY